VLDFLTQQHKLFPLLASAFAYRIAAFAMYGILNDVQHDVKAGKFTRLNEVSWQLVLVVVLLVASMKLLYAEPG